MGARRGDGRRPSAPESEHPLCVIRRKLGWSQARLARRAQLNEATIRAIELWRNHPSQLTRRKILRVVCLPYSEHINIFPRPHRSPTHTLEDRAWQQLARCINALASTLACPETQALILLKSVALAKCEHRSQDEIVGLLEALAKRVNAIRRRAA